MGDSSRWRENATEFGHRCLVDKRVRGTKRSFLVSEPSTRFEAMKKDNKGMYLRLRVLKYFAGSAFQEVYDRILRRWYKANVHRDGRGTLEEKGREERRVGQKDARTEPRTERRTGERKDREGRRDGGERGGARDGCGLVVGWII